MAAGGLIEPAVEALAPGGRVPLTFRHAPLLPDTDPLLQTPRAGVS